jgi:RHS repeat-associated protein
VTGRDNYFYTSENLLREPTNGVGYDTLNRLLYLGASEWVMDGSDPVAEYVGSGYKRYVLDEGRQPLVWYEGTGTTDRRFLSADERGSVISATDGSGGLIGINSYDEYGRPGSGNVGRWGYIGQMWMSEFSLSYFHARFYAPQLGRFMQTDPIGTAGGVNLYAYTGNDPVNWSDPLGLSGTLPPGSCEIFENGETAKGNIPVCGSAPKAEPHETFTTLPSISGSFANPSFAPHFDPTEIIVRGRRIKLKPTVAEPTPKPEPELSTTPYNPGTDYCTIVPDAPAGIDISHACHHHDDCYVSNASQSTCDRNLLSDIFADCSKQGYSLSVCTKLAGIYYVGVRSFGGFFYESRHD